MTLPELVPHDTTAQAHHIQRDVYRCMSAHERMTIAFRLTSATRHLAEAGIKARHGGYTDDQLRLAYARLVLGDALVRAAWPDHELVAP
jgi:hypothetical protein